MTLVDTHTAQSVLLEQAALSLCMLTIETVGLGLLWRPGKRAQQEVGLDIGRHDGDYLSTTVLAQAAACVE